MFGVVPRVLWERVCPPDEKNRVRLSMNCVFIDTGKDRILIDTGIGEKWSTKEIEMYGIRRERHFAQTLFEKTGCRPEDISIVINTHLHFDHAGGNSVYRGQFSEDRDRLAAGIPHSEFCIPQFPNARYLVSKNELDHAENPHERDRASYLPENWRPVQESGQLELMPDEHEPVQGLKLQTERGHSDTMQTWRLDRGGKSIYGFADLIPTRHHLAPAWVMGYDLYPVKTLEFKKEILPLAIGEGWICMFYHDPDTPLVHLTEKDGKFAAAAYVPN